MFSTFWYVRPNPEVQLHILGTLCVTECRMQLLVLFVMCHIVCDICCVIEGYYTSGFSKLAFQIKRN